MNEQERLARERIAHEIYESDDQEPDDQEVRDRRFDDYLYKRAMEKHATAKIMELYARRRGMLIDKSEHKLEVELTAHDHRRIRQESSKRLQKEIGQRAGGIRGLLPGVSGVPILSEEIRVDNQSEHSSEG